MIKNNLYKRYKLITEILFAQKVSELNLEEKSELIVINRPCFSVGSLLMNKKLDFATIRINLYPILKNFSYSDKTIFEILCNINHELEHAKTWLKLDEDKYSSYEQLNALMEFIYCANVFNLKPDKLSISGLGLFKLRKQINNNYDVSLSEINANLIGYSNALNTCKDELLSKDVEVIERIINALQLLNDNMDIYYDHFNRCMNRFSLFLEHTSSYICKYPYILEKYSILKSLFSSDGTVRPISDIYNNIDDDNKTMSKKLIMSYFMSVDTDYTEDFKNEKFKKFMEESITDYINNTLNYYKNMDVCKLFIDKTQILSDNLLLKKKNIQLLNELIAKYNLNVQCGTIICNTSIGNQKSFIKFS